MISKEELRSLIKSIKKATGLGQEKISEGAGYKKTTLTERLSQGDNLDAVYNQLALVYGDRLKNSTPAIKQTQFSADQLFAMFLEVSSKQTDIMKSIESKMAQQSDQLIIKEKVQAMESRTEKIESALGQMEDKSSVAANLNFVVATVKKLSMVQNQAIQDLRDDIARIQPAQNPSAEGGRKNKDQSDGDGQKPGRYRAKRK